MPAGTIVGEGMHDPFGPAPDGIPIRVSITIDPEAGMIEADLTDNIDCLPAGVNESRTCAMNNCMTGIFNSIDPDIPHNAGTFRRVKVKLRENCVVGIPRFPHSCSVATTNVGERLVVTTQRTIADAWDGYGLAEGACGIGPGFAVVSGTDWRKQGSAYVNQKFLGSQGGPAGPEHDGWVTYGNAVTNGLMFRDSVEIDEQKYPIRIHEIRVRPDSEGAGRRRGAPGTRVTFGPKRDAMTAAYVTDGHHHPPRGTQGGGTAALVDRVQGARRRRARRSSHPIAQVVLEPGELLGHLLSGGGGYGDPREREPERVREPTCSRASSASSARGRSTASRSSGDASTTRSPSTRRRRRRLEERAMSRFPSFEARRQGRRGHGRELGHRRRVSPRRCRRRERRSSLIGPRRGAPGALRGRAAASTTSSPPTSSTRTRRAGIVAETLGAFGAINVARPLGRHLPAEPARGGAARGLRPAVAGERPGAVRAHAGGAAAPAADGPSVTFVSSIAGHVGFPISAAYCATKGAIELMTQVARGRARAGRGSRQRHRPGQHPDADERAAASSPTTTSR